MSLPEVRSEDRDVVQALHKLGSAFQNAVGAYMVDNPSRFPKGTLSKIISGEDDLDLHGLLNTRSNVDESLSIAEMEAQSTYVGLHIHCLFMKCAEQYLFTLGVPFKDIAGSVDVDLSDTEETARKLEVCDRYQLAPMKRFLELKQAG
jgi:hypothetical protein